MNRLLILAGLVAVACQPGGRVLDQREFSKSISQVLEAHGGYKKWSAMNGLSFDLKDEHHTIRLKDRKVRIDSKKGTTGFDGKQVWVAPDSADIKNARFYHSLFFYFFSMPFVLSDPGISYEELEDKELMGRVYHAVKISFEDRVGDSPKDNYIVYSDPVTHQMEWLMYTSTYRSNEVSDQYNLIKYEQWATYNGLKLPVMIQWYKHENGVVGEPAGATMFENVVISPDMPDDHIFEMPAGARVAD